MKIIGLIDPSIASFNLGDKIVAFYCRKILEDMFPDHFFIDLPAYIKNDERIQEIVNKSDHIFFLGTAPITKEITFRWPIIMDQYQKKVVLMGVGFNNMNPDNFNSIAKEVYLSNLSTKYKHSIRDTYSEFRIAGGIGLGAINTSCPTLWNLCSELKTTKLNYKKTNNVVFTVNSSRGDLEKDSEILKILHFEYERILFYPQTPNDLAYLQKCISIIRNKYFVDCNISIIKPTLNSLNDFYSKNSKYCNYVGARLHGGIHCLNFDMKTVIISVDQRATTIRANTGLPVLTYDELAVKGDELLISAIRSEFIDEITLPVDKITEWKNQFK